VDDLVSRSATSPKIHPQLLLGFGFVSFFLLINEIIEIIGLPYASKYANMLFLWMNTLYQINTFGWWISPGIPPFWCWDFHLSKLVEAAFWLVLPPHFQSNSSSLIFYFTALFLSNTLQLNITKISYDCKIVDHWFSAIFSFLSSPICFWIQQHTSRVASRCRGVLQRRRGAALHGVVETARELGEQTEPGPTSRIFSVAFNMVIYGICYSYTINHGYQSNINRNTKKTRRISNGI